MLLFGLGNTALLISMIFCSASLDAAILSTVMQKGAKRCHDND